MTAFLDTSVVVRYVVAEPLEQAKQAAELIESDRPLVMSTVALVESAFVLTRNYGIPRGEVVDTLIELIDRPNLSVHEIPKASAIEALLLCRPSHRVSFADAFIWAAARMTPKRHVLTFDRRFPSIDVQRELLA